MSKKTPTKKSIMRIFTHNGISEKQNNDNTLEWYKKAACQGNSDAQFNLGYFYLNGQGVAQNYEKAFEWFEKAALQGDPDAQFKLGIYYAEGQGIEQNYEKAFEWYEKAAQQDDSNAQTNLGTLYKNGQGVEQNYEKAFEWYEKAALQGNSISQANLGLLYLNGQGIEQNYEKAFEWFEKSEQQNNPDAQFNLGILYLNGQGVEQNYEKAFEWFEKAALQGNSNAQFNLGYFYLNGQGVAQNYEKAFEWFEKAALQGDPDAQNNLGILYLNGEGVEQNYEKSFGWYEKAALQDNSNAQFSLGELYEFGIGVEQSDEKAFEWYKKAAVNSNASAQEKLDNSYLNEQSIDMNNEEDNQDYEDFQYKSSECFNLDKDELLKLIQESLLWCGSKKKISETMTDVSEKYAFNVEFDMSFLVSALSTITKGKLDKYARRVAEKIASINAVSFTDEAIIISGKILRYSFLQICGKVWDFNEGQYKPHKLFIQHADEILAISSNEADFLEEIINRIISKREPDIQSYYVKILENSESPYIKKICIDILRSLNYKEDLLSKYDAGFELCRAICLWHNISSIIDEQIKYQISLNRSTVKNKDAVMKLEKSRTKNAPQKYELIKKLLRSAEDKNYTLAYQTHLEVLDFYSSKKVFKRIKANLVEEGEYEKLSEELYKTIQSTTTLNTFDCIMKGIEEEYPIYNLYVRFWYFFVKTHQLTEAKRWADMLIDPNPKHIGINYGEIYYWYSKLYRDGSGEMEQSHQKQEELLMKAYNAGSGKAAMALSKFYSNEGDANKAAIFRNVAKERGVSKSDDEGRMPTLDEMIVGSKKIGEIAKNILDPIDTAKSALDIVGMVRNWFI